MNGRRIRETFSTKGEAETRAQEIRTQVENEGRAAFTLSAGIRTEAVRAVEQLTPHNATITEAVDHYVEHVLKYRTAPTVAEVVEKLLADAAANQRRERTIKDLRHRLSTFAKTYGDRRVAEITREELKDWLHDPTLAARSRINYAVKLSQLWNYAIANGWAENNIPASIPRPNAEDGEPDIFTVEQVARLLEHAADYDLLAYVALGLFAGLRSAEINRLDWSNVKLAERSIIVGAAVAKKRSRRVVEINDTLAAWLPACAKTKGPVVPLDSNRTLYARLARLAKAVGLKAWPDNGLRHSCASYSLALLSVRLQRAAMLEAEFITGQLNPPITKTERVPVEDLLGIVVLDPGLPARLSATAVDGLGSKFQRYESAIENKLYRALHELERLQRLRAGEQLPAPVVADVGVHSDKDLASFGKTG